MNSLQLLRLRSEGCEISIDYNSVLSKFQCTSYSTPPPAFVESRLLSCAFARKEKQGHVLAVTCEEGQIIILDTNSYVYDSSDFGGGSNALFSVEWSEIDMKLITTSGDHAVGLWDLRDDGGLTKLNSFKAHRCSVKTACFKPQNSDIFASGGRDGNIYVWDSRTPNRFEPEQYIINCHKKASKKNENSSITCIVYQDDYKLISCADTDSHINVWDLRKTYLRTTDKPIPVYQLPSPEKNCLFGYTHMVTNRNRTKLYANSLRHSIYCYNISAYSKTPEKAYRGHSVRNFFSKLSLSPDDKYIAGTDSDDKIFIWKIQSPGEPIVKLSGKQDMLNGLSDISWCPEECLKLATSSDYPCPWIWTVPLSDEDSPPSSVDLKDEKVSFVETLPRVPVKCQRNAAMVSALFKNRKLSNESLSPLKLPNSIVDGSQVHTCCGGGNKPTVKCNWLMNIQNERKKSSAPNEEFKTPSPAIKVKNKKRKRPSMSPGNNLIKYLKKYDENVPVGK